MKKIIKRLLSSQQAKVIKEIDIVSIRDMVKEFHRKSIIADNSDILKPKAEVTYASGGCYFFTKTMSYEQFIIDLYELEKIQDSIK